jgi:putative membrane protein
MNINEDFKETVAKKIKLIEKNTTCEVVPMIVKSSGVYRESHFTWAIVFSILFPSILYFSPFHFTNPIDYIYSQMLGLVAGLLISFIPLFKRVFIKKSDLSYEVEEKAANAFLNYNLHLTLNHNGILILVSLFERKIKIICDKNVKDKLEQQVFNDLVSNFGKNFKSDGLKNSFLKAIDELHIILSIHFKREENSKNELAVNELSDQLVLEL